VLVVRSVAVVIALVVDGRARDAERARRRRRQQQAVLVVEDTV
jgi:hypothetical protein